MNRATAVLILMLAALLEVGGDAIVRAGLHRSGIFPKTLLFLLGAFVLFAYGYTVNTPAWDFGRLLGIYVVLFFVIAQLVSWLAFDQPPTFARICGGLLIMAGGAVIAWFQ